jgi:hypothetical protein
MDWLLSKSCLSSWRRGPVWSAQRLVALLLVALQAGLAVTPSVVYTPSRSDSRFLDDLEHRAFRYFVEAADPSTGVVLDRARNDGTRDPRVPNVASIAATGFGLTALCIGADRNWIAPKEAERRVLAILQFFDTRAYNNHGWFYHFIDATTGARIWLSEVSSIDTALLLAGVLTAREYFAQDPEIVRLANDLYDRVDFRWMLNGDPELLSQGWRPEHGFLPSRWNAYCELMILYLLAIGSPTHAIRPDAWYAWRRDTISYDGYTYIAGGPLFVYQYSHAWIDFRNRREDRGRHIDWFQNSIAATRAHRAFCLDLRPSFPRSYGPDLWGITASDSATGYRAWGGPPRDSAIDGTLVPCAAAGSLMFTPDISVPDLRNMRDHFGRIWGTYGFADAFNPTTGWTDPDVIGIDLGITLLSAENLRNSTVWSWFMRSPEVVRALDLVGLR